MLSVEYEHSVFSTVLLDLGVNGGTDGDAKRH